MSERGGASSLKLHGSPADETRAFVEAGTPWTVRVLILVIGALFCAAFLWAGVATVDELVRATGRTEPRGHVKVLNHPRGGQVAVLRAHEGERVAAGALLASLDGRVAASELAQTLGRWQVKVAEAARLDSEAHDRPMRIPAEVARARPDLADTQGRLRQARRDTLKARRQALVEAVDGHRNGMATAAAERARLAEGQVHVERQLAAMRELSDRGLYPKLKLAAAEKELADLRGQRRKADTELSATGSSLAEARSRLTSLDHEWEAGVLAELAEVTAERDRLEEQLAAQRATLADLEIRAPVAGTILDLAIVAEGQSIGAQDTIMKLVPDGAEVQVEARVGTEDIGRVHIDMPATVKVRAFDYLRHGTLGGRVVRVAADATPEPGADGRSSYVVAVAVERQQLGAAAGDRALMPGMAVDVELKAGTRTILSFLTDRLWKARDAAFTEG